MLLTMLTVDAHQMFLMLNRRQGLLQQLQLAKGPSSKIKTLLKLSRLQNDLRPLAVLHILHSTRPRNIQDKLVLFA